MGGEEMAGKVVGAACPDRGCGMVFGAAGWAFTLTLIPAHVWLALLWGICHPAEHINHHTTLVQTLHRLQYGMSDALCDCPAPVLQSQAKALNAELRRGPSLTQPPASAARAALLGSSRPAASSATAAGGRTAGAGSQSAGGGGLGGLRATPSTAGGAGLVWAPQQLPRAPGAAAAGKGAAKAAAGTAGGAQRSALLGAGGGGGAKGQSGSFSKRLTDRERTRVRGKGIK